MSKQKAKFKKFGPPPQLLAVGPSGEIEALPFSKNNNSPVEIRKGKLVLAAWMRDDGWLSLSEAFAQDSRAPVRNGGMKAYKDWLKARKDKRAQVIAGYTHAGGKEPRQKFAPYPDHLLPEEALLRRAGKGSNAIASFVPGIPGLEVDPDDAMAAMPVSMQEHQTVDQVYETAVTAIDGADVTEEIDIKSDDAPKQGRRRRTQSAGDSPDGGDAG